MTVVPLSEREALWIEKGGPERMTFWLDFRDVSKAEMARRLRKSDVAVGAWCSGKWPPTQDNLLGFCEELDITAEQFWADPIGGSLAESTAAAEVGE